jgi:broad specificity phosphatase PhoE
VRKLVLIKHAMPEIVPEVPSKEWALGERGRKQAAALAYRLANPHPARIVSSVEPKAAETGRIVSAQLNLPFEIVEGLHENDRTGLPYLNGAEYDARFERFFSQPDFVVVGRESAIQAEERFSQAISHALAKHPAGNIVVTTHGTVMTLFASVRSGMEPFPLWKCLQCPSYIVFDLPEFEVIEIVDEISEDPKEKHWNE